MPHRLARRRRVRRFVVLVVGITTLIQLPTLYVLSHLLGRADVVAAPVWTTLALVVATVGFFVRFRPGSGDRRRSLPVRHLVELPFFVHWCASFVFLPLSIAVALVGAGASAAMGQGPRLPADALTGAWLFCVVAALYAVYVRRRLAVVRRLEVPVTGLPAAFDGYRIVQLSDLHVGSWTPPKWADRWVAQANREHADLAVVTGDLVSSGDSFIDDTARSVAKLRARDGVFVSLGNHDYFASTGKLVAACRREGLTVLRNEGVVLPRSDRSRVHSGGGRGAPTTEGRWGSSSGGLSGGAASPPDSNTGSVFLAALDDSWQGRDDIEAALAGRPAGMTTILLAHEPKLWRQALSRKVALTLAGHTHGGQLGVPFLSRRWNLARFFEPWSLGLYQQGSSTLYVHAGLGTTGPPGRWGVAPEIAVLTLRCA